MSGRCLEMLSCLGRERGCQTDLLLLQRLDLRMEGPEGCRHRCLVVRCGHPRHVGEGLVERSVE